MEVTPQIEHHKLNVDGVILNVRLDYKKMQVSFLDDNGNKNEFQFTDRGREHLGGWIKVLRALEKATLWADERLEAEATRQSETKHKKTVDLMIAISDKQREMNKK